MCFTKYEEDVQNQSDKDWVCCACGRWLHEDCAEDYVLEDFCPLCLDDVSGMFM